MTTPQIRQLDPHVAELISAGEVVERPASVVKELVENALDAGATAVAVELQNGGMRLIRVTDNGCGIAAAELPAAFLRHATSKLRSAEDLGGIGTLGFRGEALAAIAAVSRVEISTCRRGETGSALHLEGGVPGAVEAAGAPEGTAVAVRDLFFNTPARLKFMKKDSAETAAVNGLMQHLALSRPEVSFRFSRDGAEALHTPGDGKLASAVYAALGREFARSLTAAEGRGGDVRVAGFVTKPLNGRGSRGMQVFFVNGRFIKSQLLTAALEEGYRNQLMKGRFPGCVLHLELPATEVDVNVHPAKTTVKFAREREVFDAVYHTVLDSLAADGAPQRPTPEVRDMANPRQDFYQTMDAGKFRAQTAARQGRNGAPAWGPAQTQPIPPDQGPKPPPRGWDTELSGSARVADVLPGGRAPAARRISEPREARPFAPAIPTGQADGQTALTPGEAPWRIAGEVLKTYIVCEDEGQNVWLIDKHAAHERVNFDRLTASAEPPMRQTLLQPLAAELGREDGAALLENLPLLETLGFACEDFGDGAVLVREAPADLDAGDVSATLEELAAELRAGHGPAEKRQALLRTMACKAAIKAGWDTDQRELRALVEKVQSGEVQYCPHGRPVKARLSKHELEKLFKRA